MLMAPPLRAALLRASRLADTAMELGGSCNARNPPSP